MATYEEQINELKAAEQTELNKVNEVYGNAINQTNQMYNDLVDQNEQWKDTQQQIQQEQTDFTIQKLEQEKEQAQKDYTKEQSAAYVDYQKESNKYGANAEAMADNGMLGTGYSESSRVNMYTAYQNRVASARESLNQANINFTNAIKEAQLTNSAKQAEIALQAYKAQLELVLQGFGETNRLYLEQIAQQQSISDRYYNRIEGQKALAYQKEQDQVAADQWKKEYEMSLAANGLTQTEDGRIIWDESILGGNVEEEAADQYGNSKEIVDSKDYYFKNGYQPRYINGEELIESGMKTDILPSDSPISSGQNIWKAGDRYYAWYGEIKDYIDVTEVVTFSNGYQPKYMDGHELYSVGTIQDRLGEYGNLPGNQNVWCTGYGKFYVWNGKTKSYEDVSEKMYSVMKENYKW